jgi:hypothetical protein
MSKRSDPVSGPDQDQEALYADPDSARNYANPQH